MSLQRILVAAGLAAAVATTAACGDEPVAPVRVVPLSLSGSVAGDTISLADSIVLTASGAGGARPRRVVWSVPPGDDSTVADTFVYRPAAFGEFVVRAVAQFDDGTVGSAARRVVAVARANGAPTASIKSVSSENFLRVPVGDTIELFADAAAADGRPLAPQQLRWFRRSAAGALQLLGTGVTLSVPVREAGTYTLRLVAGDAAGPRGIAERDFQAYDPIRPARWRRAVVETLHGAILAAAPGGPIFLSPSDRGPGGGGGGVCSACGVSALDPAAGFIRWWTRTGVQATPPTIAPDGAIYLSGERELADPFAPLVTTRLIPFGAVAWQQPDAGGQQALRSDGTLAATTAGNQPAVRLLRPDGSTVWTTPSLVDGGVLRALAVGRGDTLFAFGTSSQPTAGPVTNTVAGVSPAGVVLWSLGFGSTQIPVPTAPSLVVADDSTLIVAAEDTVAAVRTSGASARLLWRTADTSTALSPAVGRDGVLYLVSMGELRARRVADGARLWSVAIPGGAPAAGSLAVTSGPVLAANGDVIVGAGSLVGLGVIVAFDAATGAERWRRVLAGGVRRPMLLTAEGLLVSADASGHVEAFDLGAGPLASPWPMAFADPLRTSRVRP